MYTGKYKYWRDQITSRLIYQMYVVERKTQREIADYLGLSITPIQRAMAEYGITSRDVSERNKALLLGSKNPSWKGERASYKAFHQRLNSVLGRPKSCVGCGTTNPHSRFEWHNQHGTYHLPESYVGVCKRCHSVLNAVKAMQSARGVSKVGERWLVRVQKERRTVYQNRFDTEAEALFARKEVVERICAEYTKTYTGLTALFQKM